ncbi:hypothetical protein AWENTII_005308 [Aspergillus wentii]|nr:hypothetical protein MW887_000754 [Aspergillus wentii]
MTEHIHPGHLVDKDDASETMHVEHKKAKMETVQGSVALDMARRTSPPSPWSSDMRKLYLVLTVAYLCSALNGTRGRLIANAY